jgi:hypothetical protein
VSIRIVGILKSHITLMVIVNPVTCQYIIRKRLKKDAKNKFKKMNITENHYL